MVSKENVAVVRKERGNIAYLTAKGSSQRLDGLGLARARRAVRVAAKAHQHSLSQRQIALVRQRRVHELGAVALILARSDPDRSGNNSRIRWGRFGHLNSSKGHHYNN